MIVVICSAVLRKDDTFLLIQETKKSAAGKWGLPGGKLETGESLHECVIRETLEETGITITNPKLLKIINKPNSSEGNTVVKFIFSVEQTDTPIADHEDLPMSYFCLEELTELHQHGALRGNEIINVLSEHPHNLDLSSESIITVL